MASHAPPPARISDYITVTVPAAIPPDDIGHQLQPFLSKDPNHVWAVVEALDETQIGLRNYVGSVAADRAGAIVAASASR